MTETDNDLSFSEVTEPVPPLARALTSGSRGYDVARLQLELKRGGVDPGPIDGIVGSKTEAAVAKFRDRHGVPGDEIGPALWAKVIEVAAQERMDDLRGAAEELEEQASEHRSSAVALEQEGKTQRESGASADAGSLMEEAGETWLEGASAWELAAELWREAARVGEPYVTDDRGWKAYARWGRAADAARLYAGRARTALGAASEDLEAAGATDHTPRIAAARAEARARAAR